MSAKISGTTTTMVSATAIILLLTISLWILLSHATTKSGVEYWQTNKDARINTSISQAVAGKTKQEVLQMLGNPDGRTPSLNLAQVPLPSPKPATIYYSMPRFGFPGFVQAIEFSANQKVVRSYSTLQDPLQIAALMVILACLKFKRDRRQAETVALASSSSQRSNNTDNSL
jgi:hypothetical protein